MEENIPSDHHTALLKYAAAVVFVIAVAFFLPHLSEQTILSYQTVGTSGMKGGIASDDETVAEEAGQAVSIDDSDAEELFHPIIKKAADRYGVEVALVKAVIMVESRYNPNAVSHKGAKGLMQLMPRTAEALGVKDSFNPEINVNAGVKYLRKLINRYDGDTKLALAAYNAGMRHVRYYDGIPPFRATRNYIDKVFHYYRYYKDNNGRNVSDA